MKPIAEASIAACGWWTHLQPKPPGHRGDRAALARLRRCATVADAMQEQATLVLFRHLERDFLRLTRKGDSGAASDLIEGAGWALEASVYGCSSLVGSA